MLLSNKEVNSVALGLAAKKEIVAEVSDVASRALSVAVAEYHGDRKTHV